MATLPLNVDMSATGDDLRKYLIVPSAQATPSVSSSSPTANPSTSVVTRVSEKDKAGSTMEMEPPAALKGELNDVFRIEDYLAAHEAERAAQLSARDTAKQMQQQQPKKLKATGGNAPLQPVAVGARSSDHTVALHHKYQTLGIPQPSFKFAGRSDLGWTVEMSFPGTDVEELQGELKEEGTFNSKQEAKEAISKRALELVVALEDEGKIKKPEKAKKRKAGITATAQQDVLGETKEPGQNYIGQLLEFQRATCSPQPTYTDYAVGTRFACLLTLDSHADKLGSLDSLHSSKKAARQEAARHAVEHFKAQNLWPESFTNVGGIKKKKVQSAAPQPISALPSSSFSPTTTNPSDTPIPIPTTTTTTTSGQSSYAQRVAQLAAQLSLSTPEWIYESSPNPAYKDFHTVHCVFRNSGPHEGPIGEVRNVFGKKKAKEECARLTLEYLQDVKQKRMEYGMKMMGGIEGVEHVLDGAAGREIEGEAEMVAAAAAGKKKGAEVVERGEEGEEDEFEDAMEEI